MTARDAVRGLPARRADLAGSNLRRGGRRGMVFHQSVARGVGQGLASFVDGLVLAVLERLRCRSPKLLARMWRSVDGEAGFTRGCSDAVDRYLASPARSRNEREAERFAQRIEAWQGTIKGAGRKQAWANQLLTLSAGKEALHIRGKTSLDPSVALLCKAAGRELPALGG